MKEASYPVDERGRPDLRHYVDPPSYYAAMHAQAMRDAGHRDVDSGLTFGRRVHACWGLIAKGADAIPFALEMLCSASSDAREDGAAILAEVGRDEDTIKRLLGALEKESDDQARDGILQALGACRHRLALPAVAAVVEDSAADGDTRWTAIEALGKIVRRRFLDRPDPLEAALEWIANARRSGKMEGHKEA